MFEKLLRDCAIIAGGCIIVVTALNNPTLVNSILGKDTATQAPTAKIEPAAETTKAQRLPAQSASVVSIPKSRDGHFWTEARVNHGYINLLVDTGASVIALTPEDAEKAGILLHELNYNGSVNTAGGKVPAAYITLDSVSVGHIALRNIQAVVIKDGLTQSLLGMSYLGELQKVEANPDLLILRL